MSSLQACYTLACDSCGRIGLEPDQARCTLCRDPAWQRVKVRDGWPETWEAHLAGWWCTLEYAGNDQWRVGTGRTRGNPDDVVRGSTMNLPTAIEWIRYWVS